MTDIPEKTRAALLERMAKAVAARYGHPEQWGDYLVDMGRALDALGGEYAYRVWDKEYENWWTAYAKKGAAQTFAGGSKLRTVRASLLIPLEEK